MSILKTGFIVEQIGGVATTQDLGRFALVAHGIGQSGVLDQHAYCWANKLLNNKLGCCSIEIGLGYLQLRAMVHTNIVVVGADLDFCIDQQPQPLWQSIFVEAGQLLTWGKRRKGQWCYLSVSGGFQCTQHHGSTSCNRREQTGGLHADGKGLVTGDYLPCENTLAQAVTTVMPMKYLPNYHKKSDDEYTRVRVCVGWQYQLFPRQQREQFFQQEFSLSEKFDRVAYRLVGMPIKHDLPEMVSEGLSPGAIQIPPDGQPIIMMNDCPTIGGYVKIGTVFSLDLAICCQLNVANRLRFEPIDRQQAQQQRIQFDNFFDD